jgi:predicted dehydrogenase
MAEAQLVALVDPCDTARRKVVEQLGIPTVSDVDQLPAGIEAAVLAAPTALHVPLGIQLIRQGIHVMVEKPLAPSSAEAQQLLRVAEQYQRILQVGHVEQFNPLIVQLRPRLAGCRYIHARRCGPWTGRSTDISVVLDLMIHDIDLIASLAGEAPRSVTAWGMVGAGPLWDVAQARMSFRCGITADLLACRMDVQPDRVWQVAADGWYGRLDLQARQGHIVRSAPGATATQARPLETTEFAAPADANPLRDELRNFLRSVRALEGPRVTGTQGWQALCIAEQIERQLQVPHPSSLPWRRAG